MKYDKYSVQASPSFLTYQFQSEGPNGIVTKQVRFTKIAGYPNVYDLSFGDVDVYGNVDYLAVTDNNDGEKVLATVALAVFKFFEMYPSESVYFIGSTPSRTRLYRIAITRNLRDLRKGFHIFGALNDGIQKFQPGVDYEGFVIRRKRMAR